MIKIFLVESKGNNMSWGIDKTKPVEEQLKDYVRIEKEIDRERGTFSDLVLCLCASLSCENCPVHIHKAYRNESKEGSTGELCCSRLYDWMIQEARMLMTNYEMNQQSSVLFKMDDYISSHPNALFM